MKKPMMILSLMLFPSLWAADDMAAQLKSMAQDMRAAEDQLRDDRHDGIVQAKLSKIEHRLDVLISAHDEQEQAEQKASRQQQQQKKQPQSQPQSKKPSQPAPDSAQSPPVPPGGCQDAAQVEALRGQWAKLPKARRDELLQAYREDLPEKWKKRLEAYFTSLAAEEAREK